MMGVLRWAFAGVVLSLSLPLSRVAAQKTDLDEFLLPSVSKEPAAEPAAAAAPAESAVVSASKATRHGRSSRAGSTAAASPPPESSSGAHAGKKGSAAAEKSAPASDARPAALVEPEPVLAPSTAETSREAATPVEAQHGKRAPRERSAKLRPDKPKRVRKKTTYELACDAWHEPPPPELVSQWRATAVPPLELRVHSNGKTFVLRPATPQGDFDEAQLQIAKDAFNSWGPTPHPRTLKLVYAAALHFNAPYVTLISGVRKDRGGSRHSHGLAADIVLPGVADEDLAAFFRAQGFCGVGTYPHSGFVHIDTRDHSYFWIDSSRPNQHGRVVQVRKSESEAADAAAVARGNESFVNPPKLQKALNVRLTRRRKAHDAKLEREAARAAQSAAANPATAAP